MVSPACRPRLRWRRPRSGQTRSSWVRTDVTNNFTYFYSVTAFDLNSMASGPHTLRSAQVDQHTVPRRDAPEVVYANLEVRSEIGEGTTFTVRLPVEFVTERKEA